MAQSAFTYSKYTFTIDSEIFCTSYSSLFSISGCSVSLKSPFMQKDSTYRINVYTFNKTLEFADRIQRIDVSIQLQETVNEGVGMCEPK